MLFYACSRIRIPGIRRFLPAAAGVLLVVCIGLLEYALDKTEIPVPACYAMMIGALAGLGLLGGYAGCRQMKTNQKG